VKLLVREHKRDSSRTHARRYLYTTVYTTDLSLSEEEIEEACRVGDRGAPRVVKALGLVLLEEASGLPHDLHHQQRRQGAGGGAEPEEPGGVPQAFERHLGGPPGLMKIFKLR